MGDRRTRWSAVVAVLVLALGGLVGSVPTATAAPTVPFTAKFSANANGSIVTVGNNLLTCRAGGDCAAARAGAARDNNGYTMVDLDADADPATRNSSMSRLDLPAGSTVLWAGLYWGARLQAGAGGSGGSAAAIDRMSLRAPGDTAYRTVAASTAARDQFGPNGTSYGAYQRFADVTSLVQQAGVGEYWGADVEAATGADRYAGWAMTVVYSAPGIPLRNLTVFDGFDVVGARNPQSVTVSGFRAPLAGTVDAQLTMVAYEGDLAQTGDFTRLVNTQLATALSPGSNFFDSANGLSGQSVQSRTPADRNMLGFDIKNLGASGAIPNGATSARFTFSSNGDVYYPGVVGMAINLYAPDFTASSKTVTNLGGSTPARPGDTLQYTLNYANTGQDPATDVVSRDVLPPGTTYVPGSLAVVEPATGATRAVTDAPGDDAGEYDAATRTVRVRLGGGATATTGGRMACSGTGCTDDGTSRTAYTFQVTLDDAAGGTTVTNQADLDYRTGTTGIGATYASNPAAVDVVARADLVVTKDVTPDPVPAGGAVVSTVTVTNTGPNPATGTTLRDPTVAGVTVERVDAPPGVTCTLEVVCTLGTLPVGAPVTVTIHGRTAPGSTLTDVTNVADVSTTAFDPDLTTNVASDTAAVARLADVSVAKSVSPATAPAGATVTATLTVTNAGPSDAQDVVLTDAVADPTQLTLGAVTGTTGGATCAPPQSGSVRCTVPTLAVGATATVTVEGVLAAELRAGVAVADTATVTAGTPDPDPADNSASAQVTTTAPQADLRLAKTAPGSVVAGSTITWTLVAGNWGPSDARASTITDVVPVGVTATSVSSDRGTCSIRQDEPAPGRQRVVCAVRGFPAASGGGTQPGGTATVTVTGTVAPDFPADQVVNTGSVQSIDADPVPANNTATTTTPVTRAFDLAVSKRANRTSLPGAAPRPVEYTVTVTNDGPSAARDVAVRDLVPLVLSFDGATAEGGTCDTSQVTTPQPDAPDHGLLTCTLPGPIAPGGSATVVVRTTAETVLEGGPEVTETVTVSAPGEGPTGNNTATWTLRGEPYVDLALGKTAPATVTAGTDGVYRLTVTNHPPAPEEEQLVAPPPDVVDTLPAGVTFLGASVVGSTAEPDCTVVGQEVTCRLPADIAPGETVTVDMAVRFAPDLANGAAVVNTARVVSQGTSPDPVPENDVATATSTVVAQADVLVADMVVTAPDPAVAGAGTRRTVAFTLRNDGPSLARDVTFRHEIDLDAAVDASTLPEACSLDDGELVCAIDGADLAPGEEVAIAFDLLLAGYVAPGTYTARTEVFTTTPDVDLENNVATATTPVTAARTDLRVEKSALGTVPNPNGDGHPAYVAGRPFAYRLAVSVPNVPGGGVADARQVVIDDPVPAGFVPTSASTTQGTCTVGPVRVTCRLGTVAAWPGSAEPVVVTVYGVVDVSAEGEQVLNTATATSPTPDLAGDPTEVAASVAVDVVEQADLQLTKRADAPVSQAGGAVGFTLTTVNAGPSDVENAVVTDTLPAGLTLDAAASPGCTVTGGDPATGQEVVCALGAVGVGASVSVRVVATTSPFEPVRDVVNRATVASRPPAGEDPATDPEPGNNTASASVRIERLADAAITSSVSTTTPAAGGRITITGSTINNGPSAAWGTTGDITFPPGFVPVSADVPLNTCTWDRTPPADPTSVPWQDVSYVLHCEPLDPSQPWPPGVASTSVVVMHIPEDTPEGFYTGTASNRTSTPEVTLENNTTSQTVYVQHVSDTRVVKTLVEPDPLQAGRPATWRLTVTNDGPSDAENVVIADTVPPGTTYVSAQVDGGAVCPDPETHSTEQGDTETLLRCPVGTLEPGASASALVTLLVDPGLTGAELCNAALVGSGSLDPDAADNQAQVCGTVVPPPAADVAITLGPQTQTVASGGTFALDATVRNDGPGLATDVVATIELPAGYSGYSGVAVTWPDGRTQPADCVVGSLVCTVGDLAPGEQVVYRLVGTVHGEPGAALVLSGTTTHGEPDPEPANDTAAAAVRLLVGEAPPPTSPPATPPAAGAGADDPPTRGWASPSRRLSSTGADVLGLVVLAAAAVGAGAGLLRARQVRGRA
ncbi:DUF11 domain-containing protein [Cellulomonas sp. JZ18]|uniref:DUF11 domain-containing protein n=1 Tax=Cellulomonas sp. JZ18 TaxID=2654191 RepID=UPI0012D45BDA|nr:DUF11 domain-containing protein [Cellulomonas sp. JZ18]QGQ18122.1 DUF11 domain-containing protein [Cellulomonas sp. JZ18]